MPGKANDEIKETNFIPPSLGSLTCKNTPRNDLIRKEQEIELKIQNELKLPEGLKGYVFNVAPLPPSNENHDGNGDRMALNGDGMVYRLGFEEGKATLKTRIAKTPCYYADQIIQHSSERYGLLDKFKFYDGGIVRLSASLGSRNQLNTAFLETKNSLFLTFDGGRPYKIDPDTLELIEPAGSTKDWISSINFIPTRYIFQPYLSAAHPVCDLTKTNEPSPKNEFFIVNHGSGLRMFNALNGFSNLFNNIKVLFNLDPKITKKLMGFTNLIQYNLDQEEFKSWEMMLPDGNPVLIEHAVHQMAITEKYIIVGDIAFEIEATQIFLPLLIRGLKKVKWLRNFLYSFFYKLVQPSPYTNLYIVTRDDLKEAGGEKVVVRKVTIPREVSHFSVDYENPDNKIILHVGHSNGWDVTEWISENDRKWLTREKMPEYLAGMSTGSTDLGLLARYKINGETGHLIRSKVIGDSDKNTWALSVYTHRQLCRDSVNETSKEVKNIYWMSWGFSRDLIPERIYNAYKNRKDRVIPFENLPTENKPMTLLRLDTEKMEIVDSFEFPIGYFARSPQFVPNSPRCLSIDESIDESIDGYIVCVVLFDEPESGEPKDEFWIFHADDFKNKPIYRLSHPDVKLGQTIHSIWLDDIKGKECSKEKTPEDRRKESFIKDYKNQSEQEIENSKENLINTIEKLFVKQTLEKDIESKFKE